MRFKTKLFIQKARILALKTILFALLVLTAYLIIADMFSTESIAIENAEPVVFIETPAEPVDNSDKGIIQRVAKEEGIDWKILWGIYQKETRGNCDRVGDLHFVRESVGCYQINKYFHPDITDEQAMDLEWSSRWVAKRLKKYADRGGWDYAVAKHNGNPTNPQVQAYLASVKSIIATL